MMTNHTRPKRRQHDTAGLFLGTRTRRASAPLRSGRRCCALRVAAPGRAGARAFWHRCRCRKRPSASSGSRWRAARRIWRRSTPSRSSPRCTASRCPKASPRASNSPSSRGRSCICFGPQHPFQAFGKNRTEICALFPHIGSVIDDICLIRSMTTEAINHDPAHMFMNTGSQIAGPAEHGRLGYLRARAARRTTCPASWC